MKKDTSLKKDFEELSQLTEEFESGNIDLEQGIPKFKRGLELARKLKKRLGEICTYGNAGKNRDSKSAGQTIIRIKSNGSDDRRSGGKTSAG